MYLIFLMIYLHHTKDSKTIQCILTEQTDLHNVNEPLKRKTKYYFLPQDFVCAPISFTLHEYLNVLCLLI